MARWLAMGNVHEWIKTLAVMGAGIWAVYTFIWKDILVPSWAPASLVIEIKPRQDGPAARPEDKSDGPVRLRFRVIATNPSSRTLYLLPNVWWASAMKRLPLDSGRSFEMAANNVLNYPSVLQAEQGQEMVSTGVVATGHLFIDSQILPGESISRDLSIPLPTRDTPLVLQWVVTALTRSSVNDTGESLLFPGQRLSWSYNNKSEVLSPMLCNNGPGDLVCLESNFKSLQDKIHSFDPRSIIFSKSIMLND